MPYRESQKPMELTIKLTVGETRKAVEAFIAKKFGMKVPDSFSSCTVQWEKAPKDCISIRFFDPKEKKT